MFNKRIILHLLFWLVYYISFTVMESSYDYRFYKGYMLAELIKLPLKITCTYFLLYFVLPRFFYTKRYIVLGLYLIVLMLASGILFRILQGTILLPLFYPELEFTPWDPGRFLWAIFEVLFPSAIAVSIKLFSGRFENLQREQELKNEKMQIELSFLKSQLNPHFLFNTLNNIYGLSLVNSPETSESILKLSELLRFILNNSERPNIRIRDEINIIKHYIALEKLRYEERLQLDFQKSIDNQEQLIAPLLLLPLIENSFKHGASETLSGSFIHIRLWLKKNILSFTIRNNKESGKSMNENGIGLKNVSRQLELIYPGRHKLEMKNSENEFELSLTIDLKEYERG